MSAICRFTHKLFCSLCHIFHLLEQALLYRPYTLVSSLNSLWFYFNFFALYIPLKGDLHRAFNSEGWYTTISISNRTLKLQRIFIIFMYIILPSLQNILEILTQIFMELSGLLIQNLIFVVPCIMLYIGEISPTRCNNCVFYSQWLYSTCFGWQSHPSSGVQCCIWPQVSWLT